MERQNNIIEDRTYKMCVFYRGRMVQLETSDQKVFHRFISEDLNSNEIQQLLLTNKVKGVRV